MKKKIYKALSLLLVLAVLVTTCAHGNWFVATAADSTSDYVTSTVTPTMEKGSISGSNGSATDYVSTAPRIRTAGYYSIADFESATISGNYMAYYHFYTRSNDTYTWCGYYKDYQSGTMTLSDLLTGAKDTSGNAKDLTNTAHYFRIVVTYSDYKTDIDLNSFDSLKLTLKSHNTEVAQPTLTQGTINTGAVMPTVTTRVHTQYMIPIADYTSLSLATAYNIYWHVYDASGNWIKDSGGSWLENATTLSMSTFSGIENAVYFKLVVDATTANIADIGLTLNPVVQSVSLSESTLELTVGEQGELTATVNPTIADQSVTWASSKDAVATVDENGVVTAVGTGTATITCTSDADPTKSDECTVTVTEPEGDKVYYVSASAGTDGDGTEEKPFDSINDAIKDAVDSNVSSERNVIINVIGNGVSWTNEKDSNGKIIKQLENHEFKVLIQTAAGETTATISKDGEFADYHMGGDIEFKNVNIAIQQYNILFHKNHSAIYNSNVKFVDKDGKEVNYAEISFGNYDSSAATSAIKYDNNIEAVIKAPISRIYFSNYKGKSEVNGTMDITYDCATGKPDFRLGTIDEGGTFTTFTKRINLFIANAESITFSKTNNILFSLNSYLQVLNNTGKDINNQVALDNASSVWIVHNELEKQSRVSFNAKKGIFDISEDDKVYAFKDEEQVTESYDGQINIGEFGAGIYRFSDTGAPSIPTYTPTAELNSIAAIINKALVDQGIDPTKWYDEIKVDLSTLTDTQSFPVGDLSTVTDNHTFKVIVVSETDNKPIVNFDTVKTTFKGDMKFNNVQLNFTQGDYLFLDGHDIEVTADAEFTTYTTDSGATKQTLERIYTAAQSESSYGNAANIDDYTQNIIVAADYDNIIYFGTANEGNATTYNGDVNLVINHASSRPTVELSRKDAQTTYNGDLNINAKRFAKLTLNYVDGGVVKGENSSVQVIHDDIEHTDGKGVHWTTAAYATGSTATATTYDAIKIDVNGVEENFVDYHITDKSFDTGCIDCTETPGEYTSNTEFIISAYKGEVKPENLLVESADEKLLLNSVADPEGEWTLTTTNYFEDFKGMEYEEFLQDWSNHSMAQGHNPANANGSYSLSDEKILLTSTGYLIQDNRFISHKTIRNKTQFISMDFESSDVADNGIVSTHKRSTSLDESEGNGNIRDNGAGVALYARLTKTDSEFSAYELKVANGYIILTKRANTSDYLNSANRPGSNVVYTKSYYVSEKLATKEAYDAADASTVSKETRYQIESSDFDTSHIKSHLKYNRFPESYGEGNTINLNSEHIYRLGMSTVDSTDNGGENGAQREVVLVRILLLDVTTNTLVVDETFKDVKNTFQGEEFGFGLYGSPETDSDRYCEALIDNVWFSTEQFRSGDMAELKDINYDSYFDIRDLVRTYEYMGGTSARFNFRAADYDINGFITTNDESLIRKELLHDGRSEFALRGQIEEEAEALKTEILNVGKTNGSGVKLQSNGKYYYYPDLSGAPLKNSSNQDIEINNVYYVKHYADPDDPKNKLETVDLAVSDLTATDSLFAAGRLGANGQFLAWDGASNSSNRMICTNYFLRLDSNFNITLPNGCYAKFYLYDKDFNFLGRSTAQNLTSINYNTCCTSYEDGALQPFSDARPYVKLITQGTIAFEPVYIKLQLASYTDGSQFDSATIETTVAKLGSNTAFSNCKISAIDYYKDKTGTEEDPWTFRQFQLYGDAYPQAYNDSDRVDPLCVINSGDAVLFQRGDNFNNIEHLKVVSLQSQSTQSYTAFFAQEGVVYGAYGKDADKPILNASAKDYDDLGLCEYCADDPATCPANTGTPADESWKELWHKTTVNGKEHVYWCDVSDVIGYTDLRDNNVLNVIFDGGDKIGVRKFYADDLHTIYKDGQYTTDQATGRLYLYNQYFGDDTPVSPNAKYDDINLTRCMYGAHAHRGNGNFEIDNINFHGFGAGAFKGAGKSANIKISNCEIAFSGGMMYLSEIDDTEKTTKSMTDILNITDTTEQAKHLTLRLGLRYGNGVEMWQQSENFVIEHSYIYHTFDSAVSPQGDSDSSGRYVGFALRKNLFQYNNADLEYFDNILESDETKHTLFYNVEIKENIFQFTSFGWGTRESDKIRGIQGVLRMDMKYDGAICIDFVDNKIDTPAMEIFLIKNRINETEKYVFGESYVNSNYYSNDSILDGDTPQLSGNEYYFNYYVRNYPNVSNGYYADGDTFKDIDTDQYAYVGPAKVANDPEALENVIDSIDSSVNETSKVYWFSWDTDSETN